MLQVSVFALLCLLFSKSFSVHAAASEAGPSSFLMDTAPLNPILRKLFKSCFSEIPPLDDLFKVSGIDKGDNGPISVSLSFKVRTESNNCCVLQLGIHDELEPSKESIPKMIGSITSIDISSRDILSLQDTTHSMEIKIEICNDERPAWELVSFHPNGLFSGKLIRSFIVQGMQAMDLYNNELSEHKPPSYLTVIDTSDIREQYWLEKGITYYQSWGLHYDCLLQMGHQAMTQFLQSSRQAASAIAARAFAEENQIFDPIPTLQESEYLEFTEEFVRLINTYRSMKSPYELQHMQIRQALDEFLPFFQGDRYDSDMMKLLGENTFMYFFRHHTLWSQLARQVIVGYDPSCTSMRGTPTDPIPYDFEFIYYHSTASIENLVTMIKSRATKKRESSDRNPEERIQQALEVGLTVDDFNYFSQKILIFIIIFLVGVLWYIFSHSYETTKPFNNEMYTEL